MLQKSNAINAFQKFRTYLEKKMNLMRSLRIYETNKDKKTDVSDLPEELLVKEILEPISNMQRLQILKAVFVRTKTFSEFSELTGLRGGNLLFHLQKLVEGGMILQRHERGDYMITEKGFKVLKGIIDYYEPYVQKLYRDVCL